MSLSTPWQLSDFRAAVRLELMDLTDPGVWWSQPELNQYINDWQNVLQSQFEFVWTTSTVTLGTGPSGQLEWGNVAFGNTPWGGTLAPSQTIPITILLANVDPGMMRLDAIYFTPGGTDTNTWRPSPRTALDIERIQMDWRSVTTQTGWQPEISYQQDNQSVSFWPPPPGQGTYVFEYPVLLTLATDTDTMRVPAWTKYMAIPYCAYRAYARFSPNQDLPKAARYRRRHDTDLKRIRRTYDEYMPEASERLRPGRRWAGNILNPRQNRLQLP